MTPEELEEIPGIEPEMVENIQTAVSYYGQFESPAGGAAGEEHSERLREKRLPRKKTSPGRRDEPAAETLPRLRAKRHVESASEDRAGGK